MMKVPLLLALGLLVACDTGAPTPCSFDVSIVDENGADIEGATATLIEEGVETDCTDSCESFVGDGSTITAEADGFVSSEHTLVEDDCSGVEIELMTAE